MKHTFKLTKLQSKRKWMIFVILSASIYFTWRIFFTLPLFNGALSFICGLTLLLAELLGLYDLFLHFWNLSQLSVPQKPTLSGKEVFPDVDVFIATYNEPLELIHKTVIGCLNMHYPDPSKVHIYVLDDGNRPKMADLCNQLKVGYLTREENTHAKAGNINNALRQTHSPYVVTFDADMIPRSQFLMETIPYFIENERIRTQELSEALDASRQTPPLGFLQVPQAFYNVDCFQYRLFAEQLVPNEQNYFHREVQLGKNSSNSVIYSGSNTVINRAALEEIGGFVTGIITEDIATGIKIQSAGYQCYALDTLQASGLSPYDLDGLIKQRQRWARGCIQTFRRANPLFMKQLSLPQRLNYFDALLYWYSSLKRFIYIIAPILFSVFGILVVEAPFLQVCLFWLPFYLISNYAFRFFSGNVRTSKWTNIYETILMPPLLSAVLLESVGIKKQKFEVTPKTLDLDKEKLAQWKLAIPHSILLTLNTIGIYNSIQALFTPQWQSYLVILFWLLSNGAALILALCFTLGRPIHRKSERVQLKGWVELTLQNQTHSFRLYDLSEQGIALQSSYPHYIEDELIHLLTVSIEGRTFNLPSTFLRVDTLPNQDYKFVFKFSNLTDADYRLLILTLYDRVPHLPELTTSQLSIQDIIRNTRSRLKKHHHFARKTARIKLHLKGRFYSPNINHLTFKEFNYTHLALKSSRPPKNLTLPLKSNPNQELTYHYKKKLGKPRQHLYELKTTLSPELIQSLQSELTLWSDDSTALK